MRTVVKNVRRGCGRLRPANPRATPPQDLSYFDQTKNERWVPYVIEPAAGLNRFLMAFLIEAYAEDPAPNTKGGVDTPCSGRTRAARAASCSSGYRPAAYYPFLGLGSPNKFDCPRPASG